jgi:hypothetical protein
VQISGIAITLRSPIKHKSISHKFGRIGVPVPCGVCFLRG